MKVHDTLSPQKYLTPQVHNILNNYEKTNNKYNRVLSTYIVNISEMEVFNNNTTSLQLIT
jgi:hypothetical protein